MFENMTAVYYTILFVGGLIGLALFSEALFKRVKIPALIGWIVIGFMIRFVGDKFGLLSGETINILGFLAELGVIMLLFRVGLESNLGSLLEQLRRATFIWVVNVLISGLLAYLAAFYLLGLTIIPSLVIGVAMTATSAGVSVKIWQDAGAIKTPKGQLLLDLSELDDMSGIILMGFLFVLIPLMHSQGSEALLPILSKISGSFFLRIAIFAGLCLVFARFLENPVVKVVNNLEHKPDPMLTVVGLGFMIAALAAIFGFSLALGAFFAGLAFSNNAQTVKSEASFSAVYELFTPFFFIGIGLSILPSSLAGSLWIGLTMIIVAVLGKLIGTALPALLNFDIKSAVILGFSMVPRAEIAMVIMQKARALGEHALPPAVYSSMVLVSIVTCLLAPLVVSWLFRKWPAV